MSVVVYLGSAKSQVANRQGSAQHLSLVAITGSSINLSCTADNNTPFWDYYPHSSPQPITVYSGGRQGEDLDPRFSVDTEGCRAGKCRLMIRNVELKDAGHFVCLQLHAASRHLSLTVLGPFLFFNRILQHVKHS